MEWLSWVNDPQAWIALATLTLLEIVLGIDNIIFISILVGRLPEHQRNKGRVIGLGLAMITRILLLLSLAWVMTLTAPLFVVLEQEISGRDLILILGGLFLLGKSVHEIHNSLETEEGSAKVAAVASFGAILAQIAVIDIVFSLDSVITAVGMADHVAVMIIAVMIAVGVMMLAAKPIGDFVDSHPTIKMLALSFLILVGVALLGEGFDMHIPKGYIYFAMAFSFGVEILNLRVRKKNREKAELEKQAEG
ncbi:TerC family protein [Marinobacter sp. BGYM27]|uniref:TerC family protein n=1 Tax=Marinobacter sp. BGYM27 TaxID=2975597 RepID=UPI0021A83E57|nr:TerC family protein [Marinobacter sp. BGYM27]MDG5500164.1 TerC family protein [Marinobacter sp. BGYM27]